MLILIGELRTESFSNVNRGDEAGSAMDGIYFFSFVAVINWGIFHFFINSCYICMIATWKRREIYRRKRQIEANHQKIKEISDSIQGWIVFMREMEYEEIISEINLLLQVYFTIQIKLRV